jgi:outer membrane lipoprotein carrier protein
MNMTLAIATLLSLSLPAQAPTGAPKASDAKPAAVASASPTAEPPTAAQVITRLQARYDQVTDLAAGFTQRLTKTGSGLEITRSGQLFLKKPGLMRFDYLEPDPMFYVSDGETLLQYLPEDKLVYKLGVQGSSLAGPFRFLVGSARIDEELSLQKDGFSDEGERWRLTFTPKAASGAFRTLSLLVDKQSLDVRALVIIDPMGNVNRLELEAPSFAPLPPEGFDLSIPEGVRVQDLSK